MLDLFLLDGEVLRLFDTALVAPGGTPIPERRAREPLGLERVEQVKAAEKIAGWQLGFRKRRSSGNTFQRVCLG